MQNDLKVVSYNKNCFNGFNLTFVVLPIKQGLVFKKGSGKRDLVKIFSFEYGKVIFALLNRIVVVNVELTLVYVQCSSFERSFSKLVKVS